MKKRGRPKGSKNKVQKTYKKGHYLEELQKDKEFLKGVDTSMWQGGVIDNPANPIPNSSLFRAAETLSPEIIFAINRWYLAEVEMDLATAELRKFLK